MKIPLSKRLQACCAFVAPGDRVADVGCDHGYLGIYLLTSGIAASVIASDVNEQPLGSAMANAHRFGVYDRMEFYLSDGVKAIPRDFDTLVCAGMGADTMISILESAPWLQSASYRMILQCQSKTATLRRYLSDHGWHITKESVLRDGRFLYTVMEVIWQPDTPRLSAGQEHFPPALLVNPSKELPQYYKRILFSLNRAVTNQGKDADPNMAAALAELDNDPALQWLKEEENGNC